MYDAGTPTAHERFWAKVDKEGPVPENNPDLGQCWVWTAAMTEGAGLFHPRKGQTLRADRWSLSVTLDRPLGEGMVPGHHCGNRACVRPSHLYEDTPHDWGRNRRGTKNGQAKLTEDDVLRIRERAAAGESYRGLARDFNVQANQVGRIVAGTKWMHVGGPTKTKTKTNPLNPVN